MGGITTPKKDASSGASRASFFKLLKVVVANDPS
jgi:hypothetical protein